MLGYCFQIEEVEASYRLTSSPVWEKFVKNGKDKATCKICLRNFSTKSTSPTQNLSKHLSQVHHITLPKVVKRSLKATKPELKQSKLLDYCSRSKMSKKEQEIANDKLTHLICEEYLPFHLVNSKTFREFTHV